MWELLKHDWYRRFRSPFWRKSLAINLVLGLLVFVLILDAVFLGLYADKIISHLYKNQDVVNVFTGLLFYYFAFDLIIRILIQKPPAIIIKPYLSLPIKKSTLLHFPLIKSFASLMNFVALILLMPFFVKDICVQRSEIFAISWFVTVFALVFTNNFLSSFISKYTGKKALFSFLVIVSIAGLLYLDFSGTLRLSSYFSSLLMFFIKGVWTIIIPVCIAVGSYILAYSLLKQNAYVEDVEPAVELANSYNLSFLSNKGEIGRLVALELKLILRNKRPRATIIVGLVFILYGLMIFTNPKLSSHALWKGFGCLIITLPLVTNYAQNFFQWESSYFDFYLANNISALTWIRAKFFLFTILGTLAFIAILPYAFLDLSIIYTSLAFMLFTIGCSSYIILFGCTFNSSRIDLGRGVFMNYQGFNAAQFLYIIPIMAVPVGIFWIFQSLDLPILGLLILGSMGIIGIVFNRTLLGLVALQLRKRKLKMAVAFRKG